MQTSILIELEEAKSVVNALTFDAIGISGVQLFQDGVVAQAGAAALPQ